jgi:hypothetical protein
MRPSRWCWCAAVRFKWKSELGFRGFIPLVLLAARQLAPLFTQNAQFAGQPGEILY